MDLWKVYTKLLPPNLTPPQLLLIRNITKTTPKKRSQEWKKNNITFEIVFYPKDLWRILHKKPPNKIFLPICFLHQISLVIEVRPHEVLIPWKQTEPKQPLGETRVYMWWLGWWSKNGLDMGDCWKLGWIFFHVFGDVFFVCIFVVVFVFIISGRGYPVGDKVSSACFFFPRRRLMQI